MAYTKTSGSGILNIQISPEGTYKVTVKGIYLGAFRLLEKAKQVRNEYRAKHGMTKIED
jgi:hypothetical protein